MKLLSEYGRWFIKNYEQFRQKAYPDQGGVWTIGWGFTEGVKKGDLITLEEANNRFNALIQRFEDAVNKLVKVNINQNQFDALVSFSYNVGINALGYSTLLAKLNAGLTKPAADQFLRWNKVRDPKTGKLVESAGLTNRRYCERQLFLKEVE